MNVQHAGLAQGRWLEMPFCEQMANVGSEVGRALNWRNKGQAEFSEKAFCRALELLGFTIAAVKKTSYLKELLRVKENLLDYFYGANEFHSTDAAWNKYFYHFNVAARLKSQQSK